MTFLNVLYLILASLLILPLSILVHEVGHVLALKDLGRDNVKLRYKAGSIQAGTRRDYIGLKKKQLRYVYAAGILAGFIPIIIIGLYIHPFFYLFSIPYIAGCKQDIKLLCH